MEGRGEGEHGDCERGRKKEQEKKRLNPKTRRTEFLDMKERNRQMKAWGLGLKMIQNYG